ncbi:PLxRFG domain-containing protein [Aquincola tertiaricarbonis]|uniref:PLxRFG domain-containing protein n=1 Tax=Aquincola tertiaricarbonis TaxID=391953 RepID=A0ABY4S681_AQUTE|nr:PLxRFG domain-containing protein [Aquincola tertiaricarbonis]URI08918.1 PLxRFG domain-containing protein [Aquincola tertiaricarbonis]
MSNRGGLGAFLAGMASGYRERDMRKREAELPELRRQLEAAGQFKDAAELQGKRDRLEEVVRLLTTGAQPRDLQLMDDFGNLFTAPRPAAADDFGDGFSPVAREEQSEYDAGYEPDEANQQPAAGEPAAADAVRRGAGPVPADGAQPRIRVRALGIAERIVREGTQALTGLDASTPDDLAALAQVFRDPRYETFRVFLTKGDTIVHSTGVSSRMPGFSPMVPHGMTAEQYVQWLKDQLQATGADGYYILHNHPSGDPTPSDADSRLTKWLGAQVPGMRAHVVINSNRYAVMSGDGEAYRVETRDFGPDKLLVPSKPSAALGKSITSVKALVQLGQSLKRPGWLTLVGTDSNGEVRAIGDAPAEILRKNYLFLAAAARRFMRQSGSQSVFLVGDDGDVASMPVRMAIKNGVLRDAVGDAGRSLQQQGLFAVRSEFAGTPARNVAESVPLYDTLRSGDTLAKLQQKLADHFQSKKVFNWWHRTVGTQFHKAKVHKGFGRVYEAAQAFINDVSFVANDAADLAPGMLPKLDQLADLKKKLKLSEADQAAVAKAVFQGTLGDERVYDEAELRDKFKLTDPQIGLYQQFRAAVDKSLDFLAAGEVARYLGRQLSEFPPSLRRMVSDGRLGEFRTTVKMIVKAQQSEAKAELEDLQKRQQRERDNLAARRRRAVDNAQGGLTMIIEERFDREAQELKRQQGDARARAERKAELWDKVEADIAEKYIKIDNLKTAGYAPLMRFGRFTVDVVSQAEETPGERLFFGMYDTEAEATAAARQMAERFKDMQPVVTQGIASQEAYKLFAGMNPETLAIFADHAAMDGASRDLFEKYIKDVASSRSALKRLIRRKGIAGYSEDLPRVLAAFLTSNARATSANLHMGELDTAVDAIGKAEGDVRDEAQRLRDYVRNPTEEAARVRGLLFMQYLGGSIASAMVNLTQPVTMTLPWLSQHGGPASAAKRLTAAVRDALRKETGDPELDKALAKAEKEGIVSPSEIHQLQAEATRNLGNSPALRKAAFVWGSLFQLAEQFNRRVTFIAAYRAAGDAKAKNAFEFAAGAVDETQGVYSKANRPNWARGAVGSTLFTFKQYSVGYLEFLARLPRREQVMALAVLALFSGLQGLPFMDDADDLLDAFGQHVLGRDTNVKAWKDKALAQAFGEPVAQFILRGISASGIPVDVSGRLGMGNLIPSTGLLRKDNTGGASDLAELGGPAFTMMRSYGKAVANLAAGNLGEAASNAAPVAVANALKALDMAETGAYRDTRGRVVMETASSDAVSKAIGFQPAKVAAEQRRMQTAQQRITLAKTVEADIAGLWADGIFLQDQAKVKQAREQLQSWNESNPESRIAISMPQVLKRVRAMRTTRQERVIKAAPKEMRAGVKEAVGAGVRE